MIRVQGVWKVYPGQVEALKGVSVTIQEGEFVAVLGPSGSGKSTLLRCINGLVPVTSGSISVDDLDVRNERQLREVRRRVGMIFQQFNLVRRLTALENVLCGRLAYNPSMSSCLRLFPHSDVDIALAALERVGLADKAYARCDQLSGGQQQRVGIARALVQKPSVILADEPVASLDPLSSRHVMELLTKINEQDRVTVVTSLHDVNLARAFGRRVVGLSQGQVVLDRPGIQFGSSDYSAVYGDRPAGEGEVAIVA